ncbi:lycopene cyclase, partial [filamentous cyanobacterium CCP5]
MVFDALVIGAGPAGVIVAASLCQQGLRVGGLSLGDAAAPWPNTYGIWCDELAALDLTPLLGYRWDDCVAYFGAGEIALDRSYGLFDNAKLQGHFLGLCQGHGMVWSQGQAARIDHFADHSRVTTEAGQQIQARVVIDASGHQPALLRRSPGSQVAYQAAYGLVGRFSQPPVQPDRFVFMDYRSQHLTAAERQAAPPTFLYAMDMGEGVFFVEETSLASSPPVSFERLEKRLQRRLEDHGVQVTEVHHVERCLFPMNQPLPDFNQPVVGFGGAASMVHPASGYMVGSLLRRAPEVAQAIALALDTPQASPQSVAEAGWQALWPSDRLRKYYLYRFGLEKLMRFEETQLQAFFDTFFSLPTKKWAGFLADTLPTPDLVQAMVKLFWLAPNSVRWGLMGFAGEEAPLLGR